MKALVVIPSRLGSTRLPKKPLYPLFGKPLIQWVYEGAKTSKLASRVIVATDSEEIARAVRKINGEAILTPGTFNTGTDRVAYAAAQLPEKYDFIINVQGDEPLTTGKLVDQLIIALRDNPEASMATFCRLFTPQEDVSNPAFVKIALDKNNYAMYFSRSVIPHNRDNNPEVKYYRHIGFYGFRAPFIQSFSKLQQTSCEQAESLEQLRALENGHKIKVIEITEHTIDINTPEDVQTFESLMKKKKV